MKTINQLVPDLKKLFEGHDFDEVISEQFGKNLAQVFKDRFKNYQEESHVTGLRLSNVGWPLRKLWYTVKGFEGEALDASTKTKFLFGDLVESLFIFLVKAAGHDVQLLQHTVEYEGIPGHIDCTIDGVLVDVKSCSTPSFKKFTSGELYDNDPFGYVAQLDGYRQALGLEKAGWLIVDKTLGHFDFVPFNPKISFSLAEKVVEVKEALQSEVEPPRCYEDKPDGKSGNRVLAVGCSYCGHRFRCWSDANEGQGLLVRHYSNGLRHFTNLVKESRLNSYEEFPTKTL